MAIYNNILETIGNTPLVRLNTLSPNGVNIFLKVESFNPSGSVKDRMARWLIEDAEKRGELSPGQTVVEATSGNTGIGLAMVCAQKGYPLVIVMAENFSVERRRLMRFLGAKVVLTPAADKGTGMLAKATELSETHGYFLCRQFDNEANAEAHYNTTAREILDDLGTDHLDYWVTGSGTGGTLKGVSQRLREDSPATRVIVAEPDNSPVLGSGLPQPRDVKGRVSASHPNFRPHTMQGWSPDFISSLTESALKAKWVDDIIPVCGEESLRLARQLATQEGILAGITAGATLAASLEIANSAKPGSNIVCMIPDTGERYMSTPLFDDVPADMCENEIFLSQSTPSARFSPTELEDASPEKGRAPAVQSAQRKPTLDDGAVEFVQAMLAQHSVLMFSLQWCEFCWAARKLFRAMGIEYHSVDLDSVAFQTGDLGGKIRNVLAADLGVPTIPQIYLGGKSVGGATELLEACNNGTLQQKLHDLGIAFNDGAVEDANVFMPQWLQPRKSA